MGQSLLVGAVLWEGGEPPLWGVPKQTHPPHCRAKLKPGSSFSPWCPFRFFPVNPHIIPAVAIDILTMGMLLQFHDQRSFATRGHPCPVMPPVPDLCLEAQNGQTAFEPLWSHRTKYQENSLWSRLGFAGLGADDLLPSSLNPFH